jgi:hypothetical protein
MIRSGLPCRYAPQNFGNLDSTMGPPEFPRVKRERLERELLAELKRAEQAYRKASAEYLKVKAEYVGMFATPDGSLALYNAAEEERMALEKYVSTLKEFSELIIEGRHPGQ